MESFKSILKLIRKIKLARAKAEDKIQKANEMKKNPRAALLNMAQKSPEFQKLQEGIMSQFEAVTGYKPSAEKLAKYFELMNDEKFKEFRKEFLQKYKDAKSEQADAKNQNVDRQSIGILRKILTEMAPQWGPVLAKYFAEFADSDILMMIASGVEVENVGEDVKNAVFYMKRAYFVLYELPMRTFQELTTISTEEVGAEGNEDDSDRHISSKPKLKREDIFADVHDKMEIRVKPADRESYPLTILPTQRLQVKEAPKAPKATNYTYGAPVMYSLNGQRMPPMPVPPQFQIPPPAPPSNGSAPPRSNGSAPPPPPRSATSAHPQFQQPLNMTMPPPQVTFGGQQPLYDMPAGVGPQPAYTMGGTQAANMTPPPNMTSPSSMSPSLIRR